MPLLASSDPAFGAGVAAGQTFGALFWLLILFWIAARRSRRMKEPGANRTGYVAGLLLYGGWCATLLFSVLSESHVSGLISFPLVLAAIACVVGGMIWAVRALLQIRAQPALYTSGKGPAIRALVSGAVFCSLAGAGAWSAFQRDRLNILVRHRRCVDAHALQPLAGRQDLVGAQLIGFAAGLDLAGVRDDRGADMARHHDRTFDMRRVEPEIVDQASVNPFTANLAAL